METLFLNKGVVLPRVEEKEENIRKVQVESDNLTEPQNPSQEDMEWKHREASPFLLSHVREDSPIADPESSKQQQQQLGLGAGAGGVLRARQGGAATHSLLKPQSGRRARVKGRGKTTALPMNDEGWGERLKYYSSCLVAPCHVIDPLLHTLLLPPHLQAAARIALREASVPQPHSDSEFTVPDYFKNTDLFIDFYKY